VICGICSISDHELNIEITTSAPRCLEFFYFDAGGGHRSAATALRHVIAERFPHWRVEMVNLQDLLKSVDPVSRLTKIPSQNVYNALLKQGWTYGSVAMLRGLQEGINLYAPSNGSYITTALAAHPARSRGLPDSQFQWRYVPGATARSSRCALCHRNDGSRRLSTAFLAGKAGSVRYLWKRQSR
jgi:hypothetical protein